MLAGVSLLALSLTVAVLLGPWAARWLVAGVWLVLAGIWFSIGFPRREIQSVTLALGFVSLAMATAVRTLAGGRSAVVWLLYALAGAAMLAPMVRGRSARRDSSPSTG